MSVIILLILVIAALTIILGELRLRLLSKNSENRIHNLSSNWSTDVDRDIDALDLESSGGALIPSWTVSMRGSWRLAQGKTITISDFEDMKAEEYRKQLQRQESLWNNLMYYLALPPK